MELALFCRNADNAKMQTPTIQSITYVSCGEFLLSRNAGLLFVTSQKDSLFNATLHKYKSLFLPILLYMFVCMNVDKTGIPQSIYTENEENIIKC